MTIGGIMITMPPLRDLIYVSLDLQPTSIADATPVEKMKHALKPVAGSALDALRKQTVDLCSASSSR